MRCGTPIPLLAISQQPKHPTVCPPLWGLLRHSVCPSCFPTMQSSGSAALKGQRQGPMFFDRSAWPSQAWLYSGLHSAAQPEASTVARRNLFCSLLPSRPANQSWLAQSSGYRWVLASRRGFCDVKVCLALLFRAQKYPHRLELALQWLAHKEKRVVAVCVLKIPW
jgi:hypothetical protein